MLCFLPTLSSYVKLRFFVISRIFSENNLKNLRIEKNAAGTCVLRISQRDKIPREKVFFQKIYTLGLPLPSFSLYLFT